MGAEDFARRLDWEWFGVSAEVDLPARAAENGILRVPVFRQAGEQPEADRLMGIVRLDGKPEPRIRQTAKLAESGHDDRAVAARGLVRTMIGGHFRQDEAGQGFLDFQREQSHGERFVRLGGRSKC